MTEIIRKTFRYEEGGAFSDLGPDYLDDDYAPITFPNGEQTAVSVPRWEIEIDLHDAELTVGGIGRASNLLREEIRRLEPPQEVSDDDIATHMPTGANNPRKGYNLRLSARGVGVPPSIRNLDGYKVEAKERPFHSRPEVKKIVQRSDPWAPKVLNLYPSYLLD